MKTGPSHPPDDWTILALVQWTTAYFESHRIDSPRSTAEILLAHALEISRIGLYLRYDQPLNRTELARYKELIRRRIRKEPVAYIVGDCQAKALFGDARFADMMEQAAALSPSAVVRLAIGGAIAGFEHYNDAIAEQDGSDISDPSEGFRMLYTSGTTGRPKGVVRPLNYSTGLTGLTSAPEYGPGKGQLNLCTGPMHHGGPLVYSMAVPISQGVGTVLMDRWDAAEALRLIEKHRITHTHMVPTMFNRLLQMPEEARLKYDVSSLRRMVHAAAPCPVETKRKMIEWWGDTVWEYYAATEGGGTIVGPQDWLKKPGTVGSPWPGAEVIVVDEDGNDMPTFESGTVYMKMPGNAFE